MKLKRILSLLLAISICAGLLTALPTGSIAASSGTCGDDLTWTLDDEGALTISGTGAMNNYTSSSSAPWYSSRSSVKKVVINNGVTSIGNYAFYYCTSLTSVTIPDSVTSIGSSAFYNCTSLASVTIPDSVTSIGSYAFRNCSSLKHIYIPNSVTYIGEYAFYGCGSAIMYLGFSSEPADWNSDWDYICSATKKWCGDEAEFVIEDDFVYCISSGSAILCEYKGSDTEPIIPSEISGYHVTGIGNYAFCECTSLTSITIPYSVTSIGDSAFEGCTSLSSITIPDSVTVIGPEAFYNTGYYNDNSNWVDDILYIGNHLIDAETSVTNVTAKNGTKTIASYAFYNCTSLTSITIPDSVTSIGSYAFRNCTSLSSITIPDSVTSIGYDAFYNCTSLTSITIPDSVTSIGDYAFSNCTSLSSITIPDSVTSIGYAAFSSCSSLNAVYITDIAKWCGISFSNYTSNPLYYAESLYLNNELVTDLVIPDSVTSIGNYAFYNCTSLTSVTIPDSVTSIGNYAFYNCKSLTSITIPDSVTSIGDYAFSNCTSLSSITIPDSVTSIGFRAFYYCTSLKSIFIPDSVTSMSESVFYGTGNIVVLAEHSAKPSGWSDEWYGDVKSYNIIWNVHSSVTKDGITYALFDDGTAEVVSCVNDASAVTIPATVNEHTVTAIHAYTFADFSLMPSITLPETLLTIGDYAFNNCYQLSDVDIPDSVTSIGTGAFANCDSFYGITLPSSLTAVKATTFSACDNLTYISVPTGVSAIAADAFDGCTSLNHVYYGGTDAEWNSISSSSEVLLHTTFHCGTDAEEAVFTSVTKESCTIKVTLIVCTECGHIFTDKREFDPDGHTYSNKFTVDIEPTCEEAGSKSRHCSHCATVTDVTEIPALGHDWVETERVEPSCIADGHVTYVCSHDSEHTYEETLVSTGEHLFDEPSVLRPATCTETGIEELKCTVCTYSELITIDALGHDYIAAVTEPTCTEDGYTTHTCSGCGDSYMDSTVQALGHNEIPNSAKAATCTDIGWEFYNTCSVCDWTTYVEIPPLGHSYQDTVIAPSATEQGYTLHTCTECGDSYKDNFTDPADENAPTIVICDQKCMAGDTITVDIMLQNNPGIASFTLGFEYNTDMFTLTSVEMADGIGGQFNYAKKAVWFSFADSDYNGVWLTLTFTVAEDAQAGDYTFGVSYNPGDICNYNEDDVDFSIKRGNVTIRDYVPGDLNGDGIVNNKDIMRLVKYLSGEEVEVVEKALDTNGDGACNNKDLMRLAKYISGEEVELY